MGEMYTRAGLVCVGVQAAALLHEQQQLVSRARDDIWSWKGDMIYMGHNLDFKAWPKGSMSAVYSV